MLDPRMSDRERTVSSLRCHTSSSVRTYRLLQNTSGLQQRPWVDVEAESKLQNEFRHACRTVRGDVFTWLSLNQPGTTMPAFADTTPLVRDIG